MSAVARLDAAEREAQIAGNRRFLSDKVNGPIDGFSVPYGSQVDFTGPVAAAVHDAGHRLAFLVEGQLNHGPLGGGPIVRVSLDATTRLASALELEVFPRLRRVRDPCLRCEEVTLPEVSVLIVNWNTRALLAACLESLEQAEAPGTLELVVVDNGSNDGSAEMVRARFDTVTLVAIPPMSASPPP